MWQLEKSNLMWWSKSILSIQFCPGSYTCGNLSIKFCSGFFTPVEIYLSNFIWFAYRGNFPAPTLLSRFLHLQKFIFPILSGSYTCGNSSGPRACNILVLIQVLTPVEIYLSNFIRFLCRDNFSVLSGSYTYGTYRLLRLWQSIFWALSGSYTNDNLPGSYTHDNSSGPRACNILVLIKVLRPTTIYISTFVWLSRLQHLSFQFCPALTHAATYTFNLGSPPEPAAIYPCSNPRTCGYFPIS
jgi:hypothetical protein